MKAILVNDLSLAVGGAQYPYVRLYADSAIGRDQAPLFIPDIKVDWVSRVCVAVRISRLGKNVSEKFAMRYVDAITLVNVIGPDTSSPLGLALAQSNADTILDSAVTTGSWITCNVAAITTLNTTVNGTDYSYDCKELAISQHLSLVSRLATIKTGDFLILEPTAVSVPLIADTFITASVADKECLHIKVK